MKVEIKGKHLWFLSYTTSEFNKLQKLLIWENKYAKSLGKTVIETLLFCDKETGEYYTFFGLVEILKDEFKNFEVVADDRSDEIQNLTVSPDILDNVTLRDYQVMSIRKAVNLKTGIIEIPTGGGKCVCKGTEILMFSGEFKKVEDIRTGDVLMGADSTPTCVKSTMVERGDVYKIIPNKGDIWRCNGDHILSLKSSYSVTKDIKKGSIINISVLEYLKLSKHTKHALKLYQPYLIEFKEKMLPVEPYWLGLFLGDGSSVSSSWNISNPDIEIQDYLRDYAKKLGLSLRVNNLKGVRCSSLQITRSRNENKVNPLTNFIKGNVELKTGEKRIPSLFLFNSEENRLQLLAGLLDTDGYYNQGYYEIIVKNEKLKEDVVFLARSLGFKVTVRERRSFGGGCVPYKDYGIFYRINILGDTRRIPCKIERKKSLKRGNKDALVTGFGVEYDGIDDYYGFELEGTKLFLLKDLTVTHNTEVALGIAKVLFDQKKIKRALIITPSVPIVKQFKERALIRGFTEDQVGCVYGQEKDFDKSMVFAVINTLAQGVKEGNKRVLDFVKGADLIVMDECHHGRSDSFLRVAYISESEYLIGMSGTPFKDRKDILADEGDSVIYGLLGRLIFKISQKFLVKRGYIADTVIFMKPVKGMFKKYRSRFNVIYKREIVDNDIRNKYIIEYCDIFSNQGLKVLVSVNIKAHALSLMEDLKKKYPNINSICIFGGSEAQIYDHTGFLEKYKVDQEAFFADFELGKYDVIFATQVMDEGVDLPSVGALIMGGSGKSIRQIRQRLGRGIRSKKTGKNEVFILDFFDRGHIWMFHQSRKRLDIYLEEVESDVLEREVDFLDLIESCTDN